MVKTQQAFVEGKIKQLEDWLNRVSIINKTTKVKIEIGSKVFISNPYGNLENYQIVGSVEADPQNGLISNESPLGKALIGHQHDEEIVVKAPCGELKYRIIKVE